ncbi:MAG: glycosyltransferase family 2 protein [Bacteroidota bacterium]
MIYVLILTKNEEKDLPGCLESVKWCDDIHVFDSFSNDKTVQIAKSAGAQVTQRKFDNYSSQRNAALDNIIYKHEWIFILDADERMPKSLLQEIHKQLAVVPNNVNGFRIRRRDYLGTKWLKHAQISPYYIRLIRHGKAHYHREINEVLEVSGSVLEINGYFDHYPFSKGIKQWLEKHNSYSSMEAKRWIEEHGGEIKFSPNKALFSKDFNERRYHQKGLFYKMPGRPIIKWLYMIIKRRAFLDGKAGITYATLQAIYEYFIVLKTREILKETKAFKPEL